MKEECVPFFKAVSDETRVKIMDLLREKSMCVSEICEHFDMKQPSISHHLSILKTAGVVHGTKSGKEMQYSLDEKYVCKCCDNFISRFSDNNNDES